MATNYNLLANETEQDYNTRVGASSLEDYNRRVAAATPGTVGPYAPPAPISSSTAREIAGASSVTGQDLVNTARRTQEQLGAPLTVPRPTPAPTTEVTPQQTEGTLLGPDGQEVTFGDLERNRPNIESYLKQGYSLVSAKGNVPSWLVSSPTGISTDRTPEQIDFEQKKTQAEADVQKLRNFDTEMARDPALQGLLQNTAALWEQRIKDAEATSKSRVASLTAGGFRLGGRYSPGSFEGVISGEERAGLERVDDLLRQKQSALVEAETAYKNRAWGRYVDLVNASEKAFTKAQEEIKNLNKKTIEETAKRDELKMQASRDQTISMLREGGISGVGQMLQILGGDFTAEEVAKTLKNLAPDQETASKLTGEASNFQSFVDVGLIDPSLTPKDKWDKYIELTKTDKPLSVAEAEKLGLPFGTTESQAYGIIPRKEATDLPAKTITQIDSIRKEFDNSPIVKDFIEVQNRLLSFSSIVDSGVGGPGDLALVFEFMKALDPNSVVRETEYENAARSGNIFKGVLARYNGYLKAEGGFLPENVKDSFLKIVQEKYKSKESQYDNLYNEKGRLINKKTKEEDGIDYLTNYKTSALSNIDSKTKPSYVITTPRGKLDLGAFEQ